MGEVADRLGRSSGFIKRKRAIDGSNFVQTLVFGWLENPEASLTNLIGMSHVRGLKISAQGLDKRFTESAARFCYGMLEQMLAEAVVSQQGIEIELLNRFSEVVLIDSTVMGLPDLFKNQWPGTGGCNESNQAALKVETTFDLKHGRLKSHLMAGKTNDAKEGALAWAPVASVSLQIGDLAYFSAQRMRKIESQQAYWLSRLRHDTQVFNQQGEAIDLLKQLKACQAMRQEWEVRIGSSGLPCRLLAYRVPDKVASERRRKQHLAAQRHGRKPKPYSQELCGWTLFITNAPADKIHLAEAETLYGSRWQIELIFKLWKHHMKLASSRSQNPWRILCERYIKLLAALIQHWIVAASPIWQMPAKSLVKAYRLIADHTRCLADTFSCKHLLAQQIQQLGSLLTRIAHQNRRKKFPNTWIKLISASAGSA